MVRSRLQAGHLAVLAVLMLAWVGTASAGSFTITTTPEQDAAIAHYLGGKGRSFTKAGAETTRTPQQFLQDTMTGHLDGLTNQHRQDTIGQKLRDWDTHSAEDRAAVCAALKVSPCPGGKR